MASWRRASRFEKIMLAIATWDFVEALAKNPDQGLWRPRRGRRPGMFSPAAPEALCDIVFSHGWNFKMVAEKVGVTQRTVQRWWAGRGVPRAHRVEQLQNVANDLRGRNRAMQGLAGSSCDPAMDFLQGGGSGSRAKAGGGLPGDSPTQGPLGSIALDPLWSGLVVKDLARR